MKKMTMLVLLAIGFTGCLPGGGNVDEVPTEPGAGSSYVYNKLVFEDDFQQQSSIPDTNKWMLCPKINPDWGKYLSESYDQAYVQNNKLVLIAEKIDGQYKTGGIQTLGNFEFKYGRVDVRARFTKSVKGGWPAIWMMPSQPEFGGWPDCGEIDIMEQLNKDNFIYQTIHTHYKNTLNNNTPNPTKTASYNVNEFNTYSVKWTPQELVFYVNGNQTLSYPNLNLANESEMKQWPFDAPFYLILNHALGGWAAEIKDHELPGKTEVDWVKIYQ